MNLKEILDHPGKQLHQDLAGEYDVTALRILLILVATLAIILALTVQNKWVLAGILAYVILP